MKRPQGRSCLHSCWCSLLTRSTSNFYSEGPLDKIFCELKLSDLLTLSHFLNQEAPAYRIRHILNLVNHNTFGAGM